MSDLNNIRQRHVAIMSTSGRSRRSIFLPISPATFNLENTMDFSNVCRVCANVTDNIVPILTGEGLLLHLSRKLSKHLKISVSLGDFPRMPVVLCRSCTDTLLAFDEMVGGVRAAEAALRQRSSLLQNRREMEQTQERINRNLQEHGVRRCPLCSAALATSRYSAHLRTRHVDHLFECSNCDMLVERHDLLPHMKEHANHFAAAWNVAWSDAASMLAEGQDTTSDEMPIFVSEIVELEFSNSDIEDFEPYPTSALRTIYTPPTSIQTPPQEPEIVDVQENPPQGSLVSENPPTNSPQESMESENPSSNPVQELMESENPSANPAQDSSVSENLPANPPQESLVSENPPANPPQESLVLETSSANSPVVLKDGEEIQVKKKSIRSCPHCTRTFKTSSSFCHHIKYFHNQSGTRGTLREHDSVHNGARGQQRLKCGMKFSSKASLYVHQENEGAGKKYSCNQCPKTFRWNKQLRHHLRCHAADPRAFSERAYFLRHARTHARPEAPRAASFAQPRILRSHVTRNNANLTRGAKN